MLKKEILAEFGTFLEIKMGLNFKNRSTDLEKKLHSIARSFQFDDIGSCLEWLMKKPLNKEQLAVLTFHLTVGETYFFRDGYLFEALEKSIFPALFKQHHKDRKLRIWSAGCCTGEETYSLAMLLHRLLPDLKKWDITLIGTDINTEFLRKAEKACYKKWSFRAIAPDFKEQYFEKQEDGSYQVIPEIRKMVQFQPLNLVEDGYPNTNISDMSLILCHNVLIYFSEKEIQKTIHKFSRSLSEKGILSVAPIEVPFVSEKNLISHKFGGTIFHEKDSKAKNHDHATLSTPLRSLPSGHKAKDKPLAITHTIAAQVPAHPQSQVEAEKRIAPKENIYEECLDLYQKKRYGDVLSKLITQLEPYKKNPEQLKLHLDEVLLLVRTYANQGALQQGLEWCELALRADKLNSLAHYMHASLLHVQGNDPEAVKAFKRALFIDSNFIMAYYMLGLLEQQQGNKKAWHQNMKIALELLEKQPTGEDLPGAEGFSTKNLKNLIANSLNNS